MFKGTISGWSTVVLSALLALGACCVTNLVVHHLARLDPLAQVSGHISRSDHRQGPMERQVSELFAHH